MTHEIAVRGGMVVDGTGAPARRVDVGIADGKVVEVGPSVRGARELDATGMVVAPGFIDIHTHYDPQVLWDATLSPSCWHGVTSVVAGNCGYSIAPTKPGDRGSLVRTLDKVEDMRVATLEAGIDWDFETYGEYMDAVRRRGTLLNFGGYVGHTPVRLFVMGQEAYEREATDAEVAEMQRVVADSLRGGALGISTDRAGFHIGDGGRPVPSIAASQAETEALLRVTATLGQGIVHVAPGENYQWVYEFQKSIGRRLNWSSILTYPAAASARGDFRTKLEAHLAGRSNGADVWVQVTCRPITQQVLMVEPTSFYTMGSFKELVALSHDRRADLFADRGWRARVQADLDANGLLTTRWESMALVESATHPELLGSTIGAIARARGTSPWDTLCDIAYDDKLATRVEITFANDDVEGVSRLLQGEGCIMGLSDAGAHVGQICDAVMPTDFMSKWVRDRNVMSMEAGIRKLTGEIGDVLCTDRGYVREGSPADLVVFDWDTLATGPLRRVTDMPAHGERLVGDRPEGIAHVLVNGVPISVDGASTLDALDVLPGRTLTNA
jgi:N-acyl-D-aspartate/D-glutamate deacylase